MKRLIMFFLLLASFGKMMSQDNIMYIYRNDADFNAFFKSDIDSIVYSHYDTDSIFHREWQTQVIYTVDSIYRIPLAVIDSISFKTPEIKVNKDVFELTSEHDPFLSNCDTLQFTLSSSCPIRMRPQKNNVVVSTYDCLSFSNGIMARVVNITCDSDGIHYVCEKAELNEVYDQLVIVSNAYTYKDFIQKGNRQKQTAEYYKTLWNKRWNETIKKSGTTTSFTIEDEAHIIVTLKIKTGQSPYFRIDFTNGLKSSISFSAKDSFEEYFEKKFGEVSLGRIIIPNLPMLWIVPQFNISGYFAQGGKVSLDFNGYYKRTDKVSFIYNNKKWKVSNNPLNEAKVDVASLSMEGYAEVGLIPDILLSINGSATGLGIEYSAGIKETANFKIDAIALYDEGIYSAIKDSYARTTIPQTVRLYAQIGAFGEVGVQPFDYTYKIEPIWGKDKYILPLFANPTYEKNVGTSTTLFKYDIMHDLLLPVNVGIVCYEGKNRLKTKYLSTPYQINSSWVLKGVQSSIEDMQIGKTYTIYPIVKILGKELRANPSMEITIDSLRPANPSDSTNKIICPDSNHPHAIDLGLPSGTKWACCNVGAVSPEDSGGYYAWGETYEKNEYKWENYRYKGNTFPNCVNIGTNIANTKYDVAHIRMGEAWCMPNEVQQGELITYCKCENTHINGIFGKLLTGKNGNKIFLPAVHNNGNTEKKNWLGYYWSSTLSWYGDDYASIIGFSERGWYWFTQYYECLYQGLTVRAICPQ